MIAEKYIQQLGTALGVSSLALDGRNSCRVVLDGNGLDFEKIPDTEELFIIGVVCPLPSSGREALFYRLLTGNRLGLETDDAAFCIDSDQEEILLYRKLNLSTMDYATFEQVASTFYTHLLRWKESCVQCLENAPIDQENTEGVPSGAEMIRV